MANQITPNPSVPSQVVQEVKFPKFVNNLGIIPTSYKDSMSYYECLAWLCKYLEETVIPTVNENGEAVEELQRLYVQLNDYVTHYFDTLDVQEEINNKLDEMYDDGELDVIIRKYLKTYKIYISDYDKEENEADDTGRLQRIINDAIDLINCEVVIDELLHISDTIDIHPVTGNETLKISGDYSTTARNSHFFNGTWNQVRTGIIATNDLTIFNVLNTSPTSNEWSGLSFNKLSLINGSYTKVANNNAIFAKTVNGIVYDRASIVVKNCYFYGMNNAIYNFYSETAYSDCVIISECDFHYYINSAITLSRADSGDINNCQFVPFNQYINTLYIRGSQGLVLTNNTYSNWGFDSSSGWTLANPHATSSDDNGSFVLFSYDNNISINGFHCENHNGSPVFYCRGGTVNLNSISIPLAKSITALIRYNGVLHMNTTYIKYDNATPWVDVYSIGGNNVVVEPSCRRFESGSSIYYPLKVKSANSYSSIATYPARVGYININSSHQAKFSTPYETDAGLDCTIDQYGQIKFDISDTNVGKMAMTTVLYGDMAFTKAQINSNDNTNTLIVTCYDASGTRYTNANIPSGRIGVIIF